MILADGQELCIDGKWYRGGETIPVSAEPVEPQIVDNNDVKNIETTETVDKSPHKKGNK
jgi:hypothetical protein